MRTMKHNSRTNASGIVHGTKHNDRNFDVALADNIDPARTHLNDYWHIYQGKEMTFEEAELRFYEEHFAHQLEETNQNYRNNRHPERCKDMAAWKKVRQNAPEETTLQIGKMEEHADGDTLMECFLDYNQRLESWNEAHGRPFTQLTYARHEDEAVPHIQTRRVWHWHTDDGNLRIGQERALEQAGVELPDPDRAVGRRNNRKMTFDRMTRELWLDVLYEHGLAVEREALPDGRHNRDKEDMIRDKYEAMLKETARLRSELAATKEELSATTEEVSALQAEITVAEKRANFEHQLADAETKRTARERTRATEARQEAQKARQEAREAQAQAKALEARNEALTAQIADQKELLAQNDAIIQEQDAIIVDQERSLGLIQSYEEYLEQVEITSGHLDLGERMIRQLPPPHGLFGQRHREEKSWLNDMKEMFNALLAVISEGIRRLQIFEVRNSLRDRRSEPARKRAASLNDQLSSAFDRTEVSQLEYQGKVKDEQTK